MQLSHKNDLRAVAMLFPHLIEAASKSAPLLAAYAAREVGPALFVRIVGSLEPLDRLPEIRQ